MFASVKKSWPYDAPIWFYVRKSEKSWDFEKMKIKLGLDNRDKTQFWVLTKTSFFGLKPFFQRPLENFLLAWRTCSKYLKGPPNLVLCISKKIVTIRRTNQILCQEKWKKLRFWKNEAQNRIGIFWQNPVFFGWNFFSKTSRKISIDFTNMFKVSERST